MKKYVTTLTIWTFCFVALLSLIAVAEARVSDPPSSSASEPKADSIFDFSAQTIDGFAVPLSRYQGKVVLIVNTASQSGYTPQYASLEKLYNRYNGRGLNILAFPSNDFSAEEPGSNAEIRTFTTMNYGISYDLFSKISTTGSDAFPLFRFLSGERPITGSFTKFLVGRDGKVIARFAPGVDPNSAEVRTAVERALGQVAQK